MQILLDGSDSNTASIALGYAESVAARLFASICAPHVQNRKRGGGTPRRPWMRSLRVWYNSSLESKNYVVPGLIAVILQIIAALLTSLTIAREWEMGTMEQILSTPLRPAEMVLGKMLAYFVVGLADAAIAVLVGLFVFRVPLRGSIAAARRLHLHVPVRRAVLGHLHFGRDAQSQLQAYQMGLLSSFLPAFLLSGFIYAIETMPQPIQAITLHRARALLRDHSEGRLSQRRRAWACSGTELGFLALYAAHCVFPGDSQAESEAGVNYVGTNSSSFLRKELIQALREPRMRILLFVPPLVQLLVFGFAVNLDVDHARIAWMDMDRTPASRDLRERFEGSGRFDVVALAAQRSRSPADRSTAARRKPWCVCCLTSSATQARPRRPQVQVLGRWNQLQHRLAGLQLCAAKSSPLISQRRLGRPARTSAYSRPQPRRARRIFPCPQIDCAHPRLVQSRSATAATTSFPA